MPDEVERQSINPRLATLLDPGSHAAFERDELFSALGANSSSGVLDWAPVLLTRGPPWADPGSARLHRPRGQLVPRVPCSILTLARPELLDKRPTWGTGHRSPGDVVLVAPAAGGVVVVLHLLVLLVVILVVVVLLVLLLLLILSSC